VSGEDPIEAIRRMLPGTWQVMFLREHRAGAQQRRVVVTVVG
jgi:thiamine phosphate synthase YjbQ (UPF0047 family)